MSRPRLEVPKELTSLLLDFTVNVLLEKPTDIVDYAVNYFTKLRNEGHRNNTDHSVPETSVTCEQEKYSEYDDEMDDPPPPIKKAVNKYSRRKSVFAEQYNPEESDDENDVERVIYPKSDDQRQRLAEAVRSILLFRSLDNEQMTEVLDAMFERKVEPGDIIIKQGDDGDNFYVIEGGIYHIFVEADQEQKLVGKYENAGSFGELALMYNMPRAATIQAASEGSLWAMNRQTFRRIVLKSAFRKRKEYEQLLEGVPMLKTLEKYELMNLCDALIPKSFSDGELIIKEGDEADGMFFIESGSVKITMIKESEDHANNEVELVRLTKGQYFGELALVTQKPRAASAYAVGCVRLAFLDVAAFERLLGPCMDIMSRNVDHYQKQVIELFGSEANISNLR